ncbi:MAG TPA: c-type cytochrome biogenesis protein CcmI [Zeimonas sp.]|nr:c-type cytochrome biogenesis protein CcmI [Zeimonas sp.]
MLLWVSIAVATLVVTGIIVWPLLSARPPALADASDDERRRLAVFRDRKREIERERAAGRLSDADAAQAQADLLRQVAEDLPEGAVGATGAVTAQRTSSKFAALALAVLVPLVAIGVYQRVGAPQLAGADLRAGDRPIEPAEVEKLVAEIEQRTRDEPNDGEAWAMLAEARKMQGRHADAVDAFEKAVRLLPPDARLLTDFAESAALLAGGEFSGRPVALLEQALSVDAGDPKAIALMGAAQYRLGNLERARDYLKKLHDGLQPGSEEATQIGEVLARIDTEIAQRGAPPVTADRDAQTVTGTVTLDASLSDKARPGDTLFVIARQAGGPPIPVAVVRNPGATLPARFAIGDANAMDPSRPLSSAGVLVLEARLSRSGEAMRQPGDLYGQLAEVRPGQRDVTIVIDRVVTP